MNVIYDPADPQESPQSPAAGAGGPPALPCQEPSTHGCRPWARGEILAWAAVLLLATLAAVNAVSRQETAADKPDAGITFTLSARYLVGLHALVPQATGAQAAGETAEKSLFSELEKTAKSPTDRLRLAIVTGELLGKDAALERLDAVAADAPDLQADIDTAQALYADEEIPDFI